jgi:hypothetical protein
VAGRKALGERFSEVAKRQRVRRGLLSCFQLAQKTRGVDFSDFRDHQVFDNVSIGAEN